MPELPQEGQILVGPLFSEPTRVATIRVSGTARWMPFENPP